MRKITAFLLMCILLLGGCNDRSSDMLAMPEAPETQKQLVDIVKSILERGYEYSELRSGINRQPLQLVDLDGDGKDEGIAFLRDSVNTYKTFIYIFKANDSDFRLYDIIEGPENNLFAVAYTDVIGKEGYEIVAEWDSGDPESKIVRVYNLGDNGVELLLDISAMNYAISDLDGDGKSEFAAIARRQGKVFADIYVSSEGEIKNAKKIPLSGKGGELLRITTGNVVKNRNGIIIERKFELGKIFDVIAYDGDSFVNMLPDGKVCLSYATCEDVDGDGIIDIPEEPFETYAENAMNKCYMWKNFDENGNLRISAFTYHSFADNWYLLLPVSWSNSVSASWTIERTGCVRIHFSTREPLNDDAGGFFEAPLFTLYVLDGENQRLISERGSFTIAEHNGEILRAEVVSNSYLGIKIDEALIKSMFKKRESEWLSEIPFE